MALKSIARFATIATLASALIACSGTTPLAVSSGTTGNTPVALEARYTELSKTGGKVFTLDPLTSSVRIYVFRAGSAARLGHNHVLSAPKFSGFLYLPVGAATDARFDLLFRLDELEIDRPEYRAALGPNFATTISPEMIASTREHMLGEGNLQAGQFPLVHIQSLQISGESPQFAAKVRVEMHGQSRDMWLPLRVEGLPQRLSASGSLVLRQSDFGIKPYSVLGGLLAVQDEVVIDFNLRAAD